MTRRETIPPAALHRRALELAAARVRWLLGPRDRPSPDLDAALAEVAAFGANGLTTLCQKFALTGLLRDIFLLALAPDLDPETAAALAGHPLALRGRATPALADLVLGPDAAGALGPLGRLRHACLVELAPGPGLAQRPLAVDAAVILFLHGAPQPSEALLPALTLLSDAVPGSDPLARAISTARRQSPQPLIHLQDARRREAEMQGTGAFAALGLTAFALEPDRVDLPPAQIAALVNRDMVLLGAGCVMKSGPGTDALADQISAPLILWGPAAPQTRRPVAEVAAPQSPAVADLPPGLAVTAADLQDAQATQSLGFAPNLWTTLRRRAAAGLDDFAQRIEPQAHWADLILPEAQLSQLRQMAAFRRNADLVLGTWGFRAKSARGLGLAALFAGPSGTGKTMAAEIVASELGPQGEPLALFRVDLSAVVSKYIGETEKNIARIFDAAEGAGAVLIFDEGEALFGKRTTDVKDSHDRHANTETAYLLQRLETYTGCAIVTTNLKGTVDEAFLRRFRMVVDFPFPGAAHRARIWAAVLPASLPTDGLDYAALSRLAMSGGFIRSIALTAAFLAAEENVALQMRHIETAVRQEYGKLGKPLSESELRGFR